MKTCDRFFEAQAWASLGGTHEMPDHLSLHAARCEPCARFVESVRLGRELGLLLPAQAMDSARHEAVKFRLLAAARRGATAPGTIWRVQVGIKLLLAALVIAGAAAAGKYLHDRGAVGFRGAPAEPATASALHRIETHRSPSSVEIQWPVSVQSLTSSAPSAPSRAVASGAPSTPEEDDAAFTAAWAALRAKRPGEAAKRFDGLLGSSTLDAARRADVLYWSAQSHRQAGNAGIAIQRSRELLRQYPSAHYASDVALILGEYALAGDRFDEAALYLNRAARSERAVVRERAQRALRELVKTQTP